MAHLLQADGDLSHYRRHARLESLWIELLKLEEDAELLEDDMGELFLVLLRAHVVEHDADEVLRHEVEHEEALL